VDAILEAAAQVFREVGYAQASTNQIAVVAGVSIGSLYQYFPDKHALAAALNQRIEAAWTERFMQVAATVLDDDVETAVRKLIAMLIDCYEADPRLVHVLLTIPPDEGTPFVPVPPPIVVEALRALLEAKKHLLPGVDIEVAASLLPRAVDAVLAGALVEGKLTRKRVEPEVVKLCLGYLRAAP
jgi:AcrR family transcriptional regulator